MSLQEISQTLVKIDATLDRTSMFMDRLTYALEHLARASPIKAETGVMFLTKEEGRKLEQRRLAQQSNANPKLDVDLKALGHKESK